MSTENTEEAQVPKVASIRPRSEFRLYTRIRQYQGKDAATFSLESVRIYKDVEGNACRDKSMYGEPKRGLWAYPKIELASFQPDHYSPRVQGAIHDPCNAALCKPRNDAEYCILLAHEHDAKSLDVESFLSYYRQVRQIFGEWYHEHYLQPPDCTAQQSTKRGETIPDNSDLMLAKCLASTPSRMEYIEKLKAEGGTWEDTFDKLDAEYKRLSISPHYKSPDSLKRSYNQYEKRRRKKGNTVPGK